MTMKTGLLVALGAALILSTPAWAERTCLAIGQIYSWDARNDKTLIVEDNFHQKFKLSLMVPCVNLKFKERVGFKSIGGTQLSCLSRGDEVFVHDPGFPQRCPIIDIVPYTPQMEQADKA